MPIRSQDFRRRDGVAALRAYALVSISPTLHNMSYVHTTVGYGTESVPFYAPAGPKSVLHMCVYRRDANPDSSCICSVRLEKEEEADESPDCLGITLSWHRHGSFMEIAL